MRPANAKIDLGESSSYADVMNPIEFTVELNGNPTLAMPTEIAAQLPKSGRARVVVFTCDDAGGSAWQNAAYEQFLRDDPPEDAIYDALT